MSTYQISCTISTSDPIAKLGLEIWLDDRQIFNVEHLKDSTLPLTFDIKEDEADHELRFVMKNKTAQHTQIDATGNIVKDACITIADVAFDEIELGAVLYNNAVYTHDFNGTQDTVETKFYGEMGCNGTVNLKFSTPIYLWLLESM